MAETAIEWATHVWNPTTGCDRVSEGCDHCYALTLAKRLKAMGNLRYQVDGDPRTSGPGFGLTLHHDKVDEPLRWSGRRLVFVNSMSDLFHDRVPLEFISTVFVTMERTPHHTYQVLTKRPGRMASVLRRIRPEPLPNVWLGTSVENQRWADVRIPLLLKTPAAIRFLSCEPLLGPVDLRRWIGLRPLATGPTYEERLQDRVLCRGLHWVIAGGESGPGHRLPEPSWVRVLRDQCADAGVAFFLKQWGGRTPKTGGRELDGRMWDEMPVRR